MDVPCLMRLPVAAVPVDFQSAVSAHDIGAPIRRLQPSSTVFDERAGDARRNGKKYRVHENETFEMSCSCESVRRASPMSSVGDKRRANGFMLMNRRSGRGGL